jgi:hypothetical protein
MAEIRWLKDVDAALKQHRKMREASLDRTLEESFAASDPSSSKPNPDDLPA